jgi:hypothetical protein
VKAERVSIYNQSVQAKHPLLGVRFTNTSKSHLMQGPITVFDGATYAGDAKVLDIQPGEERLLSYAIDLGTEVEVITPNQQERLTKLHIQDGIAVRTVRIKQERTYRAKNRGEQDRTVWVEHPLRHDFELTSKTKPVEETRDQRRFEIKVPAGKDGSVTVVEEKNVSSSVSLSNADDNTIRILLEETVASDKVKSVLAQARKLRSTWASTKSERERKEADLKQITDDQVRLRANLREMPPTAEAYKKYLAKFDQQEVQIEELQGSIRTLRNREHDHRVAFDDFLRNLRVD